MKAFVTGATGFLGSHLVDLLLREGHEVTGLVRKTSDLRWLKEKPVRLIEGELTLSNPGLLAGLHQMDWCFHVAGLISTANPQDYFQVNAGGTRHCLDACLKAAPNLKRFVFVSSIAAAGPSTGSNSLSETVSPKPMSVYGKSKWEAEKIIHEFRGKIPFTLLRPTAIYGPRDPMILPVFKMARRGFFFLPTNPDILVTMVYVEDVAGACLWGAESEKTLGETFFVCDGQSYHWRDIADTLASLLNRRVRHIPLYKNVILPIGILEELRGKILRKKPRFHRGHIHQFYSSWNYSIDKIRRAGFSPGHLLESGMKQTVAGYRQMGWL